MPGVRDAWDSSGCVVCAFAAQMPAACFDSSLSGLLCLQPPVGDGIEQRLIIEPVLRRVSRGEVGYGLVEHPALAQIPADRDAIPRAGVRACERPAAEAGVVAQLLVAHAVDVDRQLAVP